MMYVFDLRQVAVFFAGLLLVLLVRLLRLETLASIMALQRQLQLCQVLEQGAKLSLVVPTIL